MKTSEYVLDSIEMGRLFRQAPLSKWRINRKEDGWTGKGKWSIVSDYSLLFFAYPMNTGNIDDMILSPLCDEAPSVMYAYEPPARGSPSTDPSTPIVLREEDRGCLHLAGLTYLRYRHLQQKRLEFNLERTRILADDRDLEEHLKTFGDQLQRHPYRVPSLADYAVARYGYYRLFYHDQIQATNSDTRVYCFETWRYIEKFNTLRSDDFIREEARVDPALLMVALRYMHYTTARRSKQQLNTRRLELLAIMNSIGATPWELPSLRSHLRYGACRDDHCVLCLGECDPRDCSTQSCYLCNESPPSVVLSGHVLVCEPCGIRAAAHGRCAFCLGHVDPTTRACVGRGDWKFEANLIMVRDFLTSRTLLDHRTFWQQVERDGTLADCLIAMKCLFVLWRRLPLRRKFISGATDRTRLSALLGRFPEDSLPSDASVRQEAKFHPSLLASLAFYMSRDVLRSLPRPVAMSLDSLDQPMSL
jgi:hypothetical protein